MHEYCDHLAHTRAHESIVLRVEGEGDDLSKKQKVEKRM